MHIVNAAEIHSVKPENIDFSVAGKQFFHLNQHKSQKFFVIVIIGNRIADRQNIIAGVCIKFIGVH